MKAFKLFSMAVAALILGACSNEDNEVQESPQQARMIPFEATIGPASGANTRTVITEGTGTYEGYLMVAWKGDEEIALVHNGIRDKVTVTKVNTDGSAVVTGSITALGSEGEAAKLVYPYDAVGAADGGTNYTPNTSADFLESGVNQNGTLDYIGTKNLDGREGDGKLYTEGGKITIKKSATEGNVVMESKTAIWKLTLTTDGTTPLEAKQVSFYIENHLIAATSVASTGKSEWTLCVAPAALSEYTGDFTIYAIDGSNTYTYKKTGGVTLENGKYYQGTVTMTRQPALGDLYYSDGTYSATLVSGKTAIGVIAYLDDSSTTNDDEITEKSNGGGHGLVLCLKNAASNLVWHSTREMVFSESVSVQNTEALKRYSNVSGYTLTSTLVNDENAATKSPAAYQAKNYTGLSAPTTGTTGWFLPSAQQWVRMMTGLGGLSEGVITYGNSFDSSHSAINLWDAALSKAGSGNYDSMTQSSMFWTSSECDVNNAIRVLVDQSNSFTYGASLYINGFVKDGNGSGNCRVRAVLAF